MTESKAKRVAAVANLLFGGFILFGIYSGLLQNYPEMTNSQAIQITGIVGILWSRPRFTLSDD